MIKFSKYSGWKTWFFSLILILIISREPNLILHPRFWAEEGSLYFFNAYKNGFLSGLFFVPAQTAGYFSFWANISAAVASLVPIKYAPSVTTLFSLSYLLLIFSIIIWGKSYLWNKTDKKILAVLLLLFAPTAIEEIWLNSINLQVYAGICSLCILFEDTSKAGKFRLFLYRILILANTLTGLYTSALLGGFLIKWIWQRRNETIIQSSIIFVASIIQVVIFLQLKFSDQISHKKLAGYDLWKAFSYTLKYFIIDPVFGPNADRILSMLGINIATITKSPHDNYVIVCGWMSLTLILLFFYFIIINKKDIKNAMLFLSFITLSFLVTYGAINGIPSSRYAAFPGLMVLFILLNNVTMPTIFSTTGHRKTGFSGFVSAIKNPKQFKNGFMILLIFISIFYGIRNFWNMKYNYENAPLWKNEIKQLEKNPSYTITIFPYPRWRFYYLTKLPIRQKEKFFPGVIYEAEDGLVFQDYITRLSDDIPGTSNKYILDFYTIIYQFDIPEQGRYQLEVRLIAKDGKSNSIFIQLDNKSKKAWHIQHHSLNWQWEKTPFKWEIDQGIHKITFYKRENTLIDQIKLVKIN